MATLIKQLVVPNSSGTNVTYEFNATKFEGKTLSEIIDPIDDRLGVLESLSLLNLIDIAEGGTSSAPYTLPTTKTVAGASVPLEAGDTIIMATGGYAKIGTGAAFRVESGDMFVYFVDGTTKDWALIQGNIDLAALRAEFATASHKHTFSGSATPNCQEQTAGGSVSSTFTGTKASHNHGVTKTDKTLSHTFVGTPVQLQAKFTGTKFTSTTKYLTDVKVSDHTYTPAGSVTITGAGAGSVGNSSTNFVKSVSVNDHSYTPAGTVNVEDNTTGISVTKHDYTPAGTVSITQPTIAVTKGKDTTDTFIKAAIKDADLVGGESNGVLTLSITTTAADSKAAAITAVGSITGSASGASATFTGTPAELTHIVSDPGHDHDATFSGTDATIKHTVTAPTDTHNHGFTGAIGTLAASFTGTEATIKHTVTPTDASVEHTPAGSVTISVGTGTANYTPAGTIAAHTISTVDSINNKEITPEGTVSSTFTGTAHKHTIDQVTISGTVSTPTT